MGLIIALFVVTVVLTLFTVYVVNNTEKDLDRLEQLLEERRKREGASVEEEINLEQELSIMGETSLTMNSKKDNS